MKDKKTQVDEAIDTLILHLTTNIDIHNSDELKKALRRGTLLYKLKEELK